MPGVQHFVNRRQQAKPGSSREVVGNQSRVPIPETKLERSEPKSTPERPSPSLSSRLPYTGQELSGLHSHEASGVHNGFDTDAEGFDDTTIRSAGDDFRQHQTAAHISGEFSPNARADNGIPDEVQVSVGNGYKQRPNFQTPVQHVDDDLVVEGDEESYEETDDEEGDGGSGDEEQMPDAMMQEFNSPGFSQYLQGETSRSKGAALQQFMASPNVRDIPTLTNAVHGPERAANWLVPKVHSVNATASDPAGHSAGHNLVNVRKKIDLEMPTGRSSEISLQQSLIHDRVAIEHLTGPKYLKTQRSLAPPNQLLSSPSRERLARGHDTGDKALESLGSQDKALKSHDGSINIVGNFSVVDGPGLHEVDHQFKLPDEGLQTRKHARDLDYSSDRLSGMTFEQLSNEPFTPAFAVNASLLPQEFAGGTMVEKVNYMLVNLRHHDTKLTQRKAFFCSLSIEQSQECGDILIDRFSEIIAKFKDARQRRRRLVKELEEEIGKREKHVRSKTGVVENDLRRLKRGGEDVVKGKVH